MQKKKLRSTLASPNPARRVISVDALEMLSINDAWIENPLIQAENPGIIRIISQRETQYNLLQLKQLSMCFNG